LLTKIDLLNHTFKSPILVASGTFGYGDEVAGLIDVNQLGGIITKSVTLDPREGNAPPRIAETSAGMLNSIGLANLGVKEYCQTKLPQLNKLETKVIINIAGYEVDDYVKTLQILEDHAGNHAGYEINISCPNVKSGGMQFGVDAVLTESLTSEMRKHTKKLLILKLSPNVTKIEDIAMAAEAGGADMISAINTVVGMGINIHKRKPVLNTVFGGLSGPAIKPIALANVHKIYKVVSVPIIGIGGIATAEDVIEFIMAGADLVQVGTANFKDPSIGLKITKGLEPLCKTLEVANIHDLKGTLEYY
jgi:dihydroorotate dehydrogenase (NAD+) catalytic subunit